MFDALKEIWLFVRERKKYWLIPILVLLAILGLLIVFAPSGVLTPFIYTLF